MQRSASDAIALFVAVRSRFVDLGCYPQPMQQHGELACYRNDRTLLRVLLPFRCQCQSPTPQVRVRSERSQDVVRRANEKTSEVGVAGLGDSQLRIEIAGLAVSRTQSEVGSDRTTALESLRILQGQNVTQRRQRSDSRDLAQQLRFWVALRGQMFDLRVEPLDLQAQSRDRVEHWRQRWLQLVGKILAHALVEVRRRTDRQTRAHRLHDAAGVIDQLGATDDEGVATAEQGSVGLGDSTAMLDRVQQLGIDPRQAGESLSVQLVVLVPAAVDQTDVSRVGVIDSCPSSSSRR